MGERQLVTARARDFIVLMLACAAGCMDAFAILELNDVFISALTGNTILMGISLVQGNYPRFVASILVFIAFIPGTLIGTKILKSSRPGQCWTSQMTKAMCLEASLIAIFFLLLLSRNGSTDFLTLVLPILVGSLAMGLQFAITSRLTVKGAAVLMVTGMLIKLFNGIAFPESKHEEEDQKQIKCDDGGKPLSDNASRFLGLIWFCFLVGAMLSAFIIQYYSLAPVLFVLGTNVVLLMYIGIRAYPSMKS